MKKQPNKIKTFISKHQKTCLVFLVVVVLATSLGLYFYTKQDTPLRFLTSLNEQQQITLGRVIGDAYQNIYGYKTVCKSEDVILTKYPEAYKKLMSENLESLNKILQKDGLNLEAAIYLSLSYNEIQLINNVLYQEMRSISNSDEKGIKSACILFEEQADNIALGMAKISKQKYDDIFRSILR